MNQTKSRALRTAVIAAVLLATGSAVSRAGMSQTWVSRWTSDLRLAQAKADTLHPNLFHTIDRAEWDAAFDSLVARLPRLDPDQATVALAAIVARVGDGHTRLTLPLGPGVEFMQGHSQTPAPKIGGLQFHQFPVRFLIDDDGVYVQDIDRVHAAVLGRRVTRIGNLTTGDAIAAVAPTIRRDNEMQLRHHLPMHLTLAEVLFACGVIGDRAQLPITVVADDGTTTVTLRKVPYDGTVDWVDARPESPTPLYLQNNDRNFWLTRVEPHIVYFQFNEVYDSDEESLAEFADRLAAAIESEPTDALIVDLRNNRGGDGSLSRPLLHAILCSRMNEPGRLFTLVGRTTFSAAMMFALDLERHTETLFVGEPTGSTPNHYGDSRKVLLPNTGLTLRVSTRYWQNDPTDNRPWIPPHVSAPMTIADYTAGRDPAVEIIRTIVADLNGKPGPLAGTWDGKASVGLNTFEMRLDFDGSGGGRMALPEVEFETEMQGLTTAGRSVSFGIDGLGKPASLQARVGKEWMAGLLGRRSRKAPFVVHRGQ